MARISKEDGHIFRLGSSRQEKECIFGVVNNEEECAKIIDMCRLGALSRVKSRLSDAERDLIRPGSIFVYEEAESRIFRWTDGKLWSSSKIYGRCLVYYELETSCEQKIERLRLSDDLDSIIKKGSEIISLDVSDKKNKKRDGLIKLTTSAVYQEKTYHLLSYFTEKFARDCVRDAIWNMVCSWELPENLALRMNYRRRRLGKPYTRESLGSAKAKKRREPSRTQSFPVYEPSCLLEDTPVCMGGIEDFIQNCYAEDNYFTF
ncbi:Gti1/Pac2 family transcription factor [Nematocida major]|uniref:Gti1/Pac2 family transcription factor n=1 Tax=Nematocida major TaxID=1912982 RepID=UPI00200817F2|nr:Gti1/Pac2 family transcription factor [Nematocida major]KAH9386391.1 Gti1/Pac2 family transcription factor [Nematocida major]